MQMLHMATPNQLKASRNYWLWQALLHCSSWRLGNAFIRHKTALLECTDPADAQHSAEANQLLNLETLLGATWGLQGQQMQPHPNTRATELCSHLRWCRNTAQTAAQEPTHPGGTRLWSHIFCLLFCTCQPAQSCTGPSACLWLQRLWRVS